MSETMSMSMSKQNSISMLLTDEELNEMLNFLYLNILDEMFFSNYDQKRMPVRCQQEHLTDCLIHVKMLAVSSCHVEV